MKKRNYALILSALSLMLLVFFCQYLFFIPINLHSFAFIVELLLALLIVFGLTVTEGARKGKIKDVKLINPFTVLMLILIVACFIGTPYTGGLSNYRNQSDVREIDFSEIPEFSTSQVQLVDKNTAIQLGDRVFGTIGSDVVSQYQIGSDWVQISLDGTLYRITPIDFGGLFKYVATGYTPGYILVDCETGEAKLEKDHELRYMTSAYLGKNLYRHLFFKDPTAIYGPAKFELDDDRTPYWVVPVYDVKWIGKNYDVRGVYLADPENGDTVYYDKSEVPSWVDNVYPVSVIYRQFSQSKYYENGLFNWSKKGIVEFTDDYAYVQFDGNVWIYTGVTSVGKDESNVGFAYISLRDGKISYIRKAGAEEYSARSSAEGAMQQYHYSAIFPSMVNIQDHPTYFMGLVDGANLIKSYAFVNYENYQMVATGSNVQDAYNSYLKLLGGQPTDISADAEEKEFTVKDVKQIVKDGNTIVVILSESDELYWYDLSNGDLLASFIKTGDLIKAKVADGRIVELLSIS